MTLHHLSIDQLGDSLRLGARVPAWALPGVANVVVAEGAGELVDLPPALTAVVVALRAPDEPAPPWCDLTCEADDVDRIVATVAANPIASTALVQLLRGAGQRSMTDGLLLESAVYSALQAGPEFARWRASTPRRKRPAPDEPDVLVERDGDVVRIMLNRPHVRNALNTAMRDALLEALEPARIDSSLTVQLGGVGPSYSAGGDLDEFGSFSDPASAHLVRTMTAIGPLLADLGDRITVTLHGACAGSGIEIPAFAHRVNGRADVSVWLPEVSLGLIPGAGGTWSLTQRIGRHRTAWLALTGRRIAMPTALEWGLIDGVVDDE